jgi:hypothetical protein
MVIQYCVVTSPPWFVAIARVRSDAMILKLEATSILVTRRREVVIFGNEVRDAFS